MAQADDPPRQASVGIDAVRDHAAHVADGPNACFAVVPPVISPLQGWTIEQQDRQIERQATFETVPFAFCLVPLEVAVDFRNQDIRQRPIYVKDVPS